MIDYFDCIKLLNYLIEEDFQQLSSAKASSSTVVSNDSSDKLQLYKSKLVSFENLMKSKTKLTDTESNDLKSLIVEVSAVCGDRFTTLSDEDSWENSEINPFPSALFISNALGAVNPNLINQLSNFQVRGKTYLTDKKKITVSKPLFHLRCIQVVENSSFQYNVALQPWCAFPKYEQSNEWLIINIMVPGATCVHVVCIFTASKNALKVLHPERMNGMNPAESANIFQFNSLIPKVNDEVKLTNSKSNEPIVNQQQNPRYSVLTTAKEKIKKSSSNDGTNDSSNANQNGKNHRNKNQNGQINEGKSINILPSWSNLLRQFWMADQRYCDSRFKLIPSVVEGNWAIKFAVGQKPAITGLKVEQKYFRGEGYFEIDINISSSSIAHGILGLVRGISKTLVVDIGFTIQGENEDELPEVLLCQTRFNHVDIDSAHPV